MARGVSSLDLLSLHGSNSTQPRDFCLGYLPTAQYIIRWAQWRSGLLNLFLYSKSCSPFFSFAFNDRWLQDDRLEDSQRTNRSAGPFPCDKSPGPSLLVRLPGLDRSSQIAIVEASWLLQLKVLTAAPPDQDQIDAIVRISIWARLI